VWRFFVADFFDNESTNLKTAILPLHSKEGEKEKGLVLKEVEIEKVLPNKNQPRKSFDSSGIEELSLSLQRDGFLQPLVVLPLNSDGFYPLVAGERRLRAAKKLGLPTVPVLIKDFSQKDSKRAALVENIQRRNLRVLEEARAYEELIQEFGYTHERCAEELGVDRSKITNFLRLLSLPEGVQESLDKGEVSMGHARALLSLKASPLRLKEAHNLVCKKGLSVRQTEALCRRLLKHGETAYSDGGSLITKGVPEDPNIEYLADRLRQKLKTKVRLLGAGGRGKIEISYFSPSEFERIVSFFNL
jgi:ParB family chromosome partitioning protein